MNQVDFYNLAFAILIGAGIGVEREYVIATRDKSKSFGGIRTFILASMLGFIVTYLYRQNIQWLLPSAFLGFIFLLLASHFKDDSPAITSEIAALITFVLGGLCALNMVLPAASIMVVVIAVLYGKQTLHNWVNRLRPEEMQTALRFALITLVVLPHLPSKIEWPEAVRATLFFLPLDIISPAKIWLVVVLVSGIGFTGYVLSRIWGSTKGLLLTSISGGLVSSTAVTMNYSRQAVGNSRPAWLAIGILLACLIMWPRIIVEALFFSPALAAKLVLPFGLIIILGSAWLVYLYFVHRQLQRQTDIVELPNPLSLKDGILFAFLYLAVQVVSWSGQKYLGDWGLYSVALLSGLTDVDAITINTAQSVTQGLSLKTGALAVYLAAVANTIVKAGMILVLAPKELAKLALPGFALMLLGGLSFFIP